MGVLSNLAMLLTEYPAAYLSVTLCFSVVAYLSPDLSLPPFLHWIISRKSGSLLTDIELRAVENEPSYPFNQHATPLFPFFLSASILVRSPNLNKRGFCRHPVCKWNKSSSAFGFPLFHLCVFAFRI